MIIFFNEKYLVNIWKLLIKNITFAEQIKDKLTLVINLIKNKNNERTNHYDKLGS